MNHFAKILAFTSLAAAVLTTGCTKKPVRPDPTATKMNADANSAGGDPLNIGNGTNFGTNPTPLDNDSTLSVRDGRVIEDDTTIRGLFDPVLFDYDQSAIKSDERAKIEKASTYLSEHPEQRILLEGHCDWRGTSEYNLGLGERRAGAVRQYLTTLGVSADRLETSSKGDLEAIENGTDSQMAQDRRVDIVVLK